MHEDKVVQKKRETSVSKKEYLELKKKIEELYDKFEVHVSQLSGLQQELKVKTDKLGELYTTLATVVNDVNDKMQKKEEKQKPHPTHTRIH